MDDARLKTVMERLLQVEKCGCSRSTMLLMWWEDKGQAKFALSVLDWFWRCGFLEEWMMCAVGHVGCNWFLWQGYKARLGFASEQGLWFEIMLYAVGWWLAVCWQGKVLKHKARPSLKEVFGEWVKSNALLCVLVCVPAVTGNVGFVLLLFGCC